MKQYLTPSQTAKLIELGFEKPKNERWVLDVANESTPSIQNIVNRQDYSIGELLKLLPSCIEWNGVYYHLHISSQAAYAWDVSYEKSNYEKKTARILPIFDGGSCLIDCLFNVLISLYEMRNDFTDIVGHDEYDAGMFVSNVFKLKEEGVI